MRRTGVAQSSGLIGSCWAWTRCCRIVLLTTVLPARSIQHPRMQASEPNPTRNHKQEHNNVQRRILLLICVASSQLRQATPLGSSKHEDLLYHQGATWATMLQHINTIRDWNLPRGATALEAAIGASRASLVQPQWRLADLLATSATYANLLSQ